MDIIFQYSEYQLCLKIHSLSHISQAVNNNSYSTCMEFSCSYLQLLDIIGMEEQIFYWLHCRPQGCSVILIQGLLLMLSFMIHVLPGAQVCEISKNRSRKNYPSLSTNENIELLFRDILNDFINSKLILVVYINSFCVSLCLKIKQIKQKHWKYENIHYLVKHMFLAQGRGM